MKPSLEAYLERKSRPPATEAQRSPCLKCRKPPITCYCASIHPFEAKPRIVILMHPQEVRHPVGTGRMAHQCLANSTLIYGSKFDACPKVQALLSDPKIFPVLLFPGPKSHNLSALSRAERQDICPPDRELVVIILDATWNHAKKMLHLSPSLQDLPRICFTPPHLSKFIVRKQPHEQCFSSLEAIHEIIELMNPSERSSSVAPHDHLLEVFEKMVALQLSFRAPGAKSRHSKTFLERKIRREKGRAIKRAALAAQKSEAKNLNEQAPEFSSVP